MLNPPRQVGLNAYIIPHVPPAKHRFLLYPSTMVRPCEPPPLVGLGIVRFTLIGLYISQPCLYFLVVVGNQPVMFPRFLSRRLAISLPAEFLN